MCSLMKSAILLTRLLEWRDTKRIVPHVGCQKHRLAENISIIFMALSTGQQTLPAVSPNKLSPSKLKVGQTGIRIVIWLTYRSGDRIT